MAENFGVEDRGKFYDGVGALRDVVQNHLLQVLAWLTMEPPVGPSADDLNDKKAEFSARCRPRIRIAASGASTRLHRRRRGGKGFYDRDFHRTAAGDRQLALGRGADLPAGRQGAARARHRGAVVHPPRSLGGFPARTPARSEPNQIVLRIDPDPGLRLQLTALDDDRWRDLHLDSSFMADLGEPLLPYERLLHGALIGDHRLFAREDGIEETWRIVQPLLDHPGEIHSYEPGSWGPDAAKRSAARTSRLATAVASR